MAGAIFIAPFYFHYICALLNICSRKKRILIFAYIFSIISLLFNLTPFFVKSVSQKLWFKYWPDAGIIYGLFLAIWGWIALYGFYLLIKSLKNISGQEKNKLRYILVASTIIWSGGSTNFPLWFNVPIPPVGNISISIYVAIVAYAIIRYRLMDIKIAITRAGIFLIVYTFVLGIPFIVLGHTHSGLFATTLAVVFATIGPLIYRFLQRKAEAVLLNQQRRYQKILLQAALGMVTEHNLDKLSKLIVYILRKAIDLDFSAIFISDKKNQFYRLRAAQTQDNPYKQDITVSEEHPFIFYLKKNREPFFFEEMPVYIKNSFDLPFQPRIIIPAFAGSDLLAFVLLGEKTNTQHYTEEDINVFKILSRQAALAIQNCMFFDESKEAQQRMFSAEKLASIGGMADGVAHQIKNRLNLFSLASGELKMEIEHFVSKHDKLIDDTPELNKTLEYLKKIAVSIIENVKKTDGIIKGMLDFAKIDKKENFFTAFSLNEVANLSSNLLIIKHETATLPITVKIDSEDMIYGIKSQLTEAIYNMLDNAYEAIQEKKALLGEAEAINFVPSIELRLTRAQDRQVIKVSDNGIGIKEEDRHKIFSPFFTTKSSYKSGSGIGVYVVKRIVEENHKGKIWFASAYMKGTDFFIELPNNRIKGG